jgi:acyl-CoA synthetase (AMP-forming)/AMP-acid ligase II
MPDVSHSPRVLPPLLDLFHQRLTAAPESVAFYEDDREFTWAQVASGVSWFASTSAGLGAGRGDRIVYIGRNAVTFYAFLFGSAAIGAIPVPVNWRLAGPELEAILDQAEATLVVVEAEIPKLLETVRSIWDGEVVATSAIGEAMREASAEVSFRDLDVAGDAVVLQLYTSGTTGLPKGAMFSNANLSEVVTNITKAWDIRDSDVSLIAMPLFHMGGLSWALTSIAGGASSVILQDVSAEAIGRACRERGVTTAFLVPAIITLLLNEPADSNPAPHLRRLMYAGSPIAEHTLLKAVSVLGCELVQTFGMTEASGAFAQLDPEDHSTDPDRRHLLSSAGKPFPWVKVKIVNPDSGDDVEDGEPGEIWTSSAQNFVGYYRSEDQSLAALTEDGWLRTGDIGYLRDEYIYLKDRLKDVVITGGENVYPAEVERVIGAHPSVSEVAVIGAPSDKWGETVTAIVVPQPGEPIDESALLEFARESLAGFKCPTSVHVIDQLPRNATGKIRKDILRRPFWSNHERGIH